MSVNQLDLAKLALENPARVLPSLTDWAQLVMQQEFPLKAGGISKIGLHNPLQVIAFLKTSGGIKVQNDIVAKIALEQFYVDNIRMEVFKAQEKKQILAGLLFLKHIATVEAHKHKVKEETIAQNTESKNKTGVSVAGSTTSVRAVGSELNNLMMQYADLVVRLATFEEEEEELKTKQANVAQQSENAEKKYEYYMNAFAALDAFILSLQEQQSPSVSYEDLINNKIAQIEQEINNITDLIQEHILQNRDEEALKLMLETNALWLQHATLINLKDMPPMQLVKIDDMEFHLDPNKLQVVKDNGKYYLLNANQDFDNLNEEDKNAAEKNFERNKHNIMSVKALVNHNQQLERMDYTGRLDEIDNDLKNTRRNNQAVQSELSSVQTSISSLQLKPQPTPNLTPLSEFRPAPNQKKQLKEFHNYCEKNPKLTIEQYFRHINKYDQPVQNFLNKELGLDSRQIDNRPRVGKTAENIFNPTSSIPSVKMNRLLVLMPALYLDSSKPAMVPNPPSPSLGKQKQDVHSHTPVVGGPEVAEEEELNRKYHSSPRPSPYKKDPFK